MVQREVIASVLLRDGTEGSARIALVTDISVMLTKIGRQFENTIGPIIEQTKTSWTNAVQIGLTKIQNGDERPLSIITTTSSMTRSRPMAAIVVPGAELMSL